MLDTDTDTLIFNFNYNKIPELNDITSTEKKNKTKTY
jgi:hypothetical protein